MTEEEYFRKNFPDSCYGDKPLSPHWDYFQYGVEFGERQSEEKIKELEQKLEQTEKDLADYQFNYPTIKKLQKELDYQKQARSIAENAVVDLTKENTDLKCECRRCIHTDCPCILSDYGKDRNGICDHFKDVFDENVELKEDNGKLDKKVELLKEELLNPKDKCYSKDKEQLTKAKKYISFLLGVVHIKNTYNKEIEEEIAKAKAFLNK